MRDFSSLLTDIERANFKLMGFDFNSQVETIVANTHSQAMSKRANDLITRGLSLPKESQMEFFNSVTTAVDSALKGVDPSSIKAVDPSTLKG